ncbi:MAG: hypothetical protein N2506_04990 [Dehalococcoidales bacterium]|nr:hypothetical protein [Dehalococcoidales bacterium]
MEERVMTPQQYPGTPGVAPPRGWVPPLDTFLRLIGVYDNSRGVWVGLPLQALTEALVAAEAKHALDRIDDRDAVQATITDGSEVGTVKTVSIEVPSGEVWFINRIVVTSPAESSTGTGDIVRVNVRISRWAYPDSRSGSSANENGRAYWSAAKGSASGGEYTINFAAQGELGEELRLVGGDKITLEATLTGAEAGADLTATLTPYGRKGKRLAD